MKPGKIENLAENTGLNPPAQSLERARQLGWDHEATPALPRLETELASRYGFGQVRRMGALPAYNEGDATVVWIRPDLGWGGPAGSTG